jgi:hypothetical protein
MTEDDLRDSLPERDVEFLLEKGWPDTIETIRVGSEIQVVFKNYQLPAAYVPEQTNLLVRLVPPYPNENPDMFWTLPHVRLLSGAWPVNSAELQVVQNDNVQWQRWSRHFGDKAQWRPGADGLRTYMASIRVEVDKAR